MCGETVTRRSWSSGMNRRLSVDRDVERSGALALPRKARSNRSKERVLHGYEAQLARHWVSRLSSLRKSFFYHPNGIGAVFHCGNLNGDISGSYAE